MRIDNIDENTPVLVVDDLVMMREMHTLILERFGFTKIGQAVNGSEALKMLREDSSYKLVVSDLEMPKMTGLDLVRAMRADDGLKNTPFIMISGRDDLAQEAKDAGANAFFAKGSNFDVLDLRNAISKIFNPTREPAKPHIPLPQNTL
ncbi:MAG: response regulator [Alphaproteobacteria bacterium]|nr:response regulator [Alphaproteobacteria bacterium]